MRRARREHEDRLQAQGTPARLRVGEEALAAAAVAIERVHREGGELRRLLLRKGVKRRATEDVPLGLEHEEAIEVALELRLAALDQHALLLERLEDLQDPGDVDRLRLADLLRRFGHHHRADAMVREKL